MQPVIGALVAAAAVAGALSAPFSGKGDGFLAGVGRGTTVIMVHGMHCNGAHFDLWRARFEAAGFAVHAPTLRHHAGSDAGTAPPRALGDATIADYVDELDVYVAALDLAEPPVLVGHSMGGLLALKLLERGVGRAAALIAPQTPSNWSEVVGPEQLFIWHRLLCWWPFQRPIKLTRFAANWGFFNRFPRGAPGRDAAERGLGYESGRAAIEMNWAPLARVFNMRKTTAALDAARIDQRLAVFSGARDRATPARYHRRIARRLAAPLTTYAGMGHWLLAEPGWESRAGVPFFFSAPLTPRARAGASATTPSPSPRSRK